MINWFSLINLLSMKGDPMATLMIRDWPDSLHRELKKVAIDRDTTLRKIMEEAARLWLRTKGKK